MIRIAAVQHDIAWEDRDATLRSLEPRVDEAVAGGAHLVLLSEMFAVGFSMATERVAEAPEGPTTAWLREQASRHGVWIGGSLPERVSGADRPANTFVVVGPRGQVHRYAKRHPFSYGGENENYVAGDATLSIDIDGVRISPSICYDLRFANQFWDQAAATDCYAVVANWPASRRTHWRALLVARAIENQAYVIGVNRVGTDGNDLDYAGDSMIVDPWGEIVADAGADEAVIAADIDPDVVAATRAKLPFLADRRS